MNWRPSCRDVNSGAHGRQPIFLFYFILFLWFLWIWWTPMRKTSLGAFVLWVVFAGNITRSGKIGISFALPASMVKWSKEAGRESWKMCRTWLACAKNFLAAWAGGLKSLIIAIFSVARNMNFSWGLVRVSIDVHVASAIIALGFLGCNTLSKWNVGHLLFSTKITHTHAHFKKKLWCSTPIADNGNLKFGGGAARKASSLRGCRFIVFRCISLLCVFLFYLCFSKKIFLLIQSLHRPHFASFTSFCWMNVSWISKDKFNWGHIMPIGNDLRG